MAIEHAKTAGDAASLLIVSSTLTGLLPPIAALFSIVWTGIQVYEWWSKKTSKNNDRGKES